MQLPADKKRLTGKHSGKNPRCKCAARHTAAARRKRLAEKQVNGLRNEAMKLDDHNMLVRMYIGRLFAEYSF